MTELTRQQIIQIASDCRHGIPSARYDELWRQVFAHSDEGRDVANGGNVRGVYDYAERNGLGPWAK